MSDIALLQELGRRDIERAIGHAVEGQEEGWCYLLDAELSENEEDPDWQAEELLDWQLCHSGRRGTSS